MSKSDPVPMLQRLCATLAAQMNDAVVVRPGDALVVAVRHLDMAAAAELKQQLEWALPESRIVVVEADLLAVGRP